MKYAPFIILRILQTLLARLNADRAWSWHHRRMGADPRYSELLIQGIAKALWQATFNQFIADLIKTAVKVRQHIKRGYLAD